MSNSDATAGPEAKSREFWRDCVRFLYNPVSGQHVRGVLVDSSTSRQSAGSSVRFSPSSVNIGMSRIWLRMSSIREGRYIARDFGVVQYKT